MKRQELIDSYYKLLHLKNYSGRTEQTYLHHLTLFLNYIKAAKVPDVDRKVTKNFL